MISFTQKEIIKRQSSEWFWRKRDLKDQMLSMHNCWAWGQCWCLRKAVRGECNVNLEKTSSIMAGYVRRHHILACTVSQIQTESKEKSSPWPEVGMWLAHLIWKAGGSWRRKEALYLNQLWVSFPDTHEPAPPEECPGCPRAEVAAPTCASTGDGPRWVALIAPGGRPWSVPQTPLGRNTAATLLSLPSLVPSSFFRTQ